MNKLIASAVSENQIAEMIGNYFYCNELFILKKEVVNTLKEKLNEKFSIWYPLSHSKAGQELKKYRVVNKKGRYKFELFMEDK